VKMQALRNYVESLRNYVAYHVGYATSEAEPVLSVAVRNGWGRRRH
jgi:hypothetical protein